ncbi:MAG: hypothetical protein KGO82_19200, partial [Bacteroidota bacterium]|nr:hypothetical protein [Bacteroidota bacterium]
QPSQKLSYAKASYESVYGTIACGWEMKDGKMKVDMKVPANTTATIVLPGADAAQVMESGTAIQSVFKSVKQEGANTIIEAGSGEYHFEYPAKTK